MNQVTGLPPHPVSCSVGSDSSTLIAPLDSVLRGPTGSWSCFPCPWKDVVLWFFYWGSVNMRKKLVSCIQSWGSSWYSSFPTKILSMGSVGKLNLYSLPAARKLNKTVQNWANLHSQLHSLYHHHLVSKRLNKAMRVQTNQHSTFHTHLGPMGPSE